VRDDVAIADRGETRLASPGSRPSTLDLNHHFGFSSGFEAGGVTGLAGSAGFPGGVALTPGFGVVSGGVSSLLQPFTQTSARTRLESIVQVLIPDFTITDWLLEKHETRQGIPISLSQLTHASGP